MSYPPLIDLRNGFWPVVHFIRPCSLFPIDNLSIYAQNFFEFCIHIVIGDEWYGIVNGQNPTIFDGVTALSPFKKWFLTCFSFTVYDIWMKLHRYVEQQRLHITKKDRHFYLSSSWVICPWLILSISVLLLFRHYISHKITFGAPSSGGVLCSACGAFMLLLFSFLWAYFFAIYNFQIEMTRFGFRDVVQKRPDIEQALFKAIHKKLSGSCCPDPGACEIYKLGKFLSHFLHEYSC